MTNKNHKDEFLSETKGAGPKLKDDQKEKKERKKKEKEKEKKIKKKSER